MPSQSTKTDFATLFPDSDAILNTIQSDGPQFYRCPEGHRLPHRLVWGRCSPSHCVDKENSVRGTMKIREPHAHEADLLPIGMERQVFAPGNQPEDGVQAEHVMELSKAKLGLLRAAVHLEAMRSFFPIPDLPPPPRGLTGKEYVDRRLADIAPFLLERKIADTFLSTPERAAAAVEELLDRTGLASKKKDGDGAVVRPVVFNFNVTAGQPDLPFLKRRQSNGRAELFEDRSSGAGKQDAGDASSSEGSGTEGGDDHHEAATGNHPEG